MVKFKPLMSKGEIEKRKIWQEQVYGKLKLRQKKSQVKISGKKITTLAGIFAPLWGDSSLLAMAVKKETKKGDSVLDLGTGSGIQGIFAAEKSSSVVSSDVNPLAVKCARLNAKNLRLDKKISVIQSDLFSNIKNRFDLIIFNPPFRWFKPRDILERGEVDENYKTLNKFFRDVRKHLNSEGRVLLVFSESGDLKYLKFLIKKYRFGSALVAAKRLNGWKYVVYRLAVPIE
jgi:release factor glutamine methyltransferase